MAGYFSLDGECVTRREIEKSKFITTSCHVCGEEEAKAFIARVSANYPGATHNCYAYISDSLGNFLRFSDDGEPQGTAGMPMLEVLKANKLCEAAVVVTRYFGGIKLGAGGLVRAYSGCVSANIAAAEKVFYENCAESLYITDYSNIDAALKFITAGGDALISSEYSDGVAFKVAVKVDEKAAFDAAFINALNGRLSIKKLREYYYPFKAKV